MTGIRRGTDRKVNEFTLSFEIWEYENFEGENVQWYKLGKDSLCNTCNGIVVPEGVWVSHVLSDSIMAYRGVCNCKGGE